MRGPGRVVVAVCLLVALVAGRPGSVRAQLAVFVGGAAAVPVAELRDVAELGGQVFVGGTWEIGTSGLALGATGHFARLPHRIDGERSEVYGLSLLTGYSLVASDAWRLRAWAGLGGAIHEHRSNAYPGLDASKWGLALDAGMAVSRPVGRVELFVSAFYSHGLGDLGTASFPTDLAAFGGGVSVPLGID